MITAATEFAATPSGYAIIAMATTMCGLFAWLGRGIIHEQRQQGNTLNLNTQALAVLVARVDPAITGVGALEVRIKDVEGDMRVMLDWRERHEKWAQGEHDRGMASSIPRYVEQTAPS